MQKLFVGNLHFDATEEDLRDFFAEAGHPVTDVKIMTDRDTGKARGFGFVTLGADDSPRLAIEHIHGMEFMRRPLTVNEAKPIEKRDNFRSGRRESRW